MAGKINDQNKQPDIRNKTSVSSRIISVTLISLFLPIVANLVSQIVLKENFWQIFQEDKKHFEAYFEENKNNHRFNDYSSYTGFIFNLNDDTIRYIKFELQSSDTINHYSIDKRYVFNNTNQEYSSSFDSSIAGGSFCTTIILRSIIFVPHDSLWLTFCSIRNPTFTINEIIACEFPDGTGGSTPWDRKINTLSKIPATNRDLLWTITLLFAISLMLLFSFQKREVFYVFSEAKKAISQIKDE